MFERMCAYLCNMCVGLCMCMCVNIKKILQQYYVFLLPDSSFNIWRASV